MSTKQLLCCLCVLVTSLFQSANATNSSTNNWTGYLNDKSLTGEVYGYLSVSDAETAGSKLRLLCHGGEFALLFDDKIVATSGTVAIGVDTLPEVFFTIDRFDAGQGISNNSDEFWDLIAQMVAGASLRVDTGAGHVHQYSLYGFTRAYLTGCGWSGLAEGYQEFLPYYR